MDALSAVKEQFLYPSIDVTEVCNFSLHILKFCSTSKSVRSTEKVLKNFDVKFSQLDRLRPAFRDLRLKMGYGLWGSELDNTALESYPSFLSVIILERCDMQLLWHSQA